MQNQPTILQQIVKDKADWVAKKAKTFPLDQFQHDIVPSDRNFYGAIANCSNSQPAYILECKKASPSKGLIRADFNLNSIAQIYQNYATAISVLTDEAYFQGDFAFLSQVRRQVPQPILCKDFIISPYQIYLARYHQADAILLMLSVLDDNRYCELRDLAHSLNMGVLTETSNEKEFERALALNAKVIGVNNRNLHDLSIDMNRIIQLAEKYQAQIPADVRLISESGIAHHRQVQKIQPFAHGFLIGSSLMGRPDLNNAVRAVIFGENKVCGLTRPQDVQAAYQSGALYGGLIFAEKSPRALSLRQAQELVTQAPLYFVGVFQDQPVDFVAKIAQQLELYAVQLHGNEDEQYIVALSEKLAGKTKIWQAISVESENASHQPMTIKENPLIHRYILDSKTASQQGGTGQTFDWAKIPDAIKEKSLLAGGISLNNIEQALQQGCLGVDLNSGVESGKGIKDHAKLAAIFAKILGRHQEIGGTI